MRTRLVSSFVLGTFGTLVAFVACTSDSGNGLTRTGTEPPGAHCATGGVKIEVGSDGNGNGTLDPSEVNAASTSYVCNGSKSSLVKTSTEAPGANCPFGGTKIETGLDASNNGVLETAEVNPAATSYVCNGGAKSSIVKASPELAAANCPFGGTKIETGLDANNDGVLDAAEVNAAATNYVCNIAPSGTISPSTGINVVVRSVANMSPTSPVTVRFTMKDDRGFPLDFKGKYSQNTALQPRFALAYFTKDATTGQVSPLTVYTKAASATNPDAQPTAYNPTAAGQGTLVENGVGAGDYTYSFPTMTTANGPVGVAYDPAKLAETHVVWIQVSRQTDEVFATNANTFYSANQDYYFIPSGSGTPLKRELVSQAGCDSCHAKFKAETTTSSAFHGGGRISAGFCNVCHNSGRTSNPAANSATFIHRIHNGQKVATANLFHGIAATYPRDIRDCNSCHKDAAQGPQALSNPSIAACTGCHDYVKFDGSAQWTCSRPAVFGTDDKPVVCNHIAGPMANSGLCIDCHSPAVNAAYHKPVAPPDPKNSWLVPGGNANTNASYVAAGGYVPEGANVITYDLKSVEAVADPAIGANKRPQITFKLKKDGTDVVFPAYAAGTVTELMPNFVGSPSVFFAFAVPQDGLATPADFNASASGYIKDIWSGTAVGAGAGTLTGPDATGYYTIELTGVQIPADATMLTGGVGYSYSLASAPPLVQTDLPAYPLSTDGKRQGGLAVPAANVSKVATGYTGRRAIVDNARCENCHGALGVAPTFHAGQRNDGPTCAFCHTPNRTSSGWSAGSKYFIHAIHAGRKRTVDYTWHATEVGPGYDEVEFPGTLNTCTTCHIPNTYDFTNEANLNAIRNMPVTAVGTGKYNSDPMTNSTFFTLSGYVTADNVTDYGPGFSYNVATGVTTPAAPTTLVVSQITTACSACHDTTVAINHMKTNGGLFYTPRSTAVTPGGSQEQCMLCHGPGRIAAIGIVHQR
jgi:OmcA/MtrC family decaheme c-type cytochrome